MLRQSLIARGQHDKGQGIRLIGPSGTGKSEQLKQIDTLFPALKSIDDGITTRRPILQMQLEPGADALGLVRQLVVALEGTWRDREKGAILRARARRRLVASGVQILIIDEADQGLTGGALDLRLGDRIKRFKTMPTGRSR